MQLVEVTDKKLANVFLRVNVTLNKNTPNYIRPLDKDIHEVFDAKKKQSLPLWHYGPLDFKK